MGPFTPAALVNLLGLITGTALYAILLVMVLTAAREEGRVNALALLSALLGWPGQSEPLPDMGYTISV